MNFLDKPTTDFNSVRDGRRSLPLWIDVDLTAARSIGAASALSINIAGNSFYVDQDTANVGNATVHFQDTNLGASSAPLFVSAGFIANVPFTQILIENAAQPGKRLRIFYGVDIDFQAGINASIAISGTVNIGNTLGAGGNVALTGQAYAASFKSIAALAANTPELIFSPAANVNGAIVHRASLFSTHGAAWTYPTLIAKNAAPASVVDGDVILSADFLTASGTIAQAGKLESPVKIAAGKGLYAISSNAEVNAMRSVLYTLL